MTSHLGSTKESGFGLGSEETSNGYLVRVSGTLDSESLSALPNFLDELHRTACEGNGRGVTVDCADLYFMNSSSIKFFVLWVVKVRNLAPHQRYRVLFRTNPRLAWQGRTLGAVCRAAPEVATVA